MSFSLTPDGTRLVRDTIAGDVTRLEQDPVDVMTTPLRLRLPQDEREVPDWAFVASIPASPDLSRQFALYHIPVDGDVLVHYEVAARVIAYLSNHNLRPIGNWDGNPRNACRAMQFIELVPGALQQQFEMQRDALRRLSNFTERGVFADRIAQSVLNHEDDVIHASHRVFTKVTGSNRRCPSVLTLADDPECLTQVEGFDSHWRVTSKIMLGERRANGRVYPLHHMRFSSGDLVDVRMKMDIVTTRGSNGIPITKVHLKFDQIIQLCALVDQPMRMFVEPVPLIPAVQVADVQDTYFEEEE